jgi:hypothetical protein
MSMLFGLLLVPAAPQMLSENAWLVEVRPGGRRYFREKAIMRISPGKAYVVPGDKLVADRSKGAFTFVIFVSPGGTATRGWIETTALRRIVPRPRSLASWTGDWKFEDASITIKPGNRHGYLHAAGTATWGEHDPERVVRGGVNVGDFESDRAARRSHDLRRGQRSRIVPDRYAAHRSLSAGRGQYALWRHECDVQRNLSPLIIATSPRRHRHACRRIASTAPSAPPGRAAYPSPAAPVSPLDRTARSGRCR